MGYLLKICLMKPIKLNKQKAFICFWVNAFCVKLFDFVRQTNNIIRQNIIRPRKDCKIFDFKTLLSLFLYDYILIEISLIFAYISLGVIITFPQVFILVLWFDFVCFSIAIRMPEFVIWCQISHFKIPSLNYIAKYLICKHLNLFWVIYNVFCYILTYLRQQYI